MAISRVHVWGYPWDAAEWGAERTADLLAALGVDALSLAMVYHEAQVLSLATDEPRIVRPVGGVPIWRARAEDLPGALRGRAVRPWLEQLGSRLEARGIALRAWCVVFHDAPLPAIENAFGDRLSHAPCPIAGAQALVALAAELGGLGLFRAMEVESAGNVPAFHGGHHDIAGLVPTPFWQVVLGMCFCPACRRLAERGGVAVDAVREALRRAATLALSEAREGPADADATADALDALLEHEPELGAYARLRAEAATDQVVRAQAAFGARTALVGSGAVSAERLALLAGVAPQRPAEGDLEMLSLAYGEPEAARADIARYRSLGWSEDRHVVGMTLVEAAVRSRDAAEERLESALAAGARRFSFYNVGILPPSRRAWIGGLSARIRRLATGAVATE